MRRLSLFILALCISTSALAANDQENCARRKGEIAIAACTRLISGGQLSDSDLTIIYVLRATAYQEKTDYDRATADFTRAIGIAEKYSSKETIAQVYVARASLYSLQNADEKAIADYHSALDLDPKNTQAAEGIKRTESALASPAPTVPLPIASLPNPTATPTEKNSENKGDDRPARSTTLTPNTSRLNGPQPRVFSEEPPRGVGIIKLGEKAYVDDGTCPEDEIKEIIGGSRMKQIKRQTRCIARSARLKASSRPTPKTASRDSDRSTKSIASSAGSNAECANMHDKIGCGCAMQNGGWISAQGGWRYANRSMDAFAKCMIAHGRQ